MGNQDNRLKKAKGFAVMDKEKHKEIAKKGGHAAHEKGVAHRWNSNEARAAGKKGGSSKAKRKNQNEEDNPIH